MADVTPTPSPLGLLGLLGVNLALGIVTRKGELGKPAPEEWKEIQLLAAWVSTSHRPGTLSSEWKRRKMKLLSPRNRRLSLSGK